MRLARLGFPGGLAGTSEQVGQALRPLAGLATRQPASGGGGSPVVRLAVTGGVSPDGSGSGNTPAYPNKMVSTETQTSNTPKVTAIRLVFGASTDAHWMWVFQLPQDYGSGGTVRLSWGASVNSGNVVWKAGAVPLEPAAGSVTSAAFLAADSSGAVAVPGTIGVAKQTEVDLTMTDGDAGDLVAVFVGRDADSGSDTAAGDAYLYAADFEYTSA